MFVRRYVVSMLVLLANALILSAADFTGTWKGNLTPESREPGSALLILKQVGDTVTGTAGPDESQRHEIVNGKVTGETVTFELPQEEGTMRFTLMLEGEALTGQVTREREGQKKTAKLILKRDQ